MAKKVTSASLNSDADTMNPYVVGMAETTKVVAEGSIKVDGIRLTSTVAI